MLRFGIGMMLAMLAMGLASGSALAQNYLCPAGPGPGERQVGMTEGGGNSGLASIPICVNVDEPQLSEPGPPARQYTYFWVSNYVAVAWHPNASDVWAIWNAQSEEQAKEGALRLCTVAMSDGCTIAKAASNTSIAIARAPDGTLWSGWGETPRKAKNDVLASCKKKGR